MQKTTITISFSLAIVLIVFIFFLGRIGWLVWLGNGVNVLFSPVEGLLFSTSQSIRPSNKEIAALKKENLTLRQQLVNQKTLEQDNTALRDQFVIANPAPLVLLPARIIAAPNFLPNFTYPETFIVDKGMNDSLGKGNTVIYQSNAIGLVTQLTTHTAFITLISNKQTVIPVKDVATNAMGMLRGLGNGEMMVENVLLSDTLHTGDTIITNPSANATSYPPGLIVGKITSVEKNPSALFQRGNVKSLVDFQKLNMVFILENR